MSVVASVWTWLVEKDFGALPAAGVLLALAVSVTVILLNLANRRKANAEIGKIEADTRAAERQRRDLHRERVRDCAGDIMRSVSAMVDELFATFYPFAYPPENVDKAKLAEAILVARRFSHEQRYRADIEKPISELGALGAHAADPAPAQLQSKALALLAKVGDKKIHVARIEAEGLNREASEAVAAWLSEIRELQVGIAALVGELSGRLSLALDDGEAIDRAA